MKIIVCGAGPVGTSIAKQLAGEDNSVTVIDTQQDAIDRINETLDVTAMVGFPSHPTVLEDAGAAGAGMIIAVTSSDETNMVVCEVANALFNIPVKIARIRHPNYLLPAWKDLYQRENIPVDYIISPEQEVANAVINRLHVPGAMGSLTFADGKIRVIEVRCGANAPAAGLSTDAIKRRYADLKVMILGIMRADDLTVPEGHDTLAAGDLIYFAADHEHVTPAMKLFGHQEKEARRVLIIGGGNIGLAVARELEKEKADIHARLIEHDRKRAEYLAAKLSRTTVILGSGLDQDILLEANVEQTETAIAVTSGDEINILASLLCKRLGAQRTFTLIGQAQSYGLLVSSLGLDVTINPREMTVSSILQYTRRGKVRAAHMAFGGQGEIAEHEMVPHSVAIGRSVADLQLPEGAKLGAILRGKDTIIPDSKTVIAEHDRLLVFSLTGQVRKVDKIFSERLDYF